MSYVMSIDRIHTKFSLVFRYLILLMSIENENINYIQLAIKDVDDGKLIHLSYYSTNPTIKYH